MLTQYFRMNIIDETAKTLLYREFLQYFVWDNKKKCWAYRKKGDVIGRIVAANPSKGERFETLMLKMWDKFVEGIAVSTKSNSSILINHSFEGIYHLRICAKAYLQIKDCTGCIDATIMEEMAEGYLKSTAMTFMNLTSSTIHNSIDEEQILYVRAMEKDAEGTILKYDIVYMFDPVTELDEPLDPRSAINAESNKGKRKQIVQPFKLVKRALFFLRDSDGS
ncbi:ATP-dependent DNA helicase [Abeliophyllum distichum]|uniref:ATP-dependent DNA helicase n=1 Tax=Abeliophyllum distichum TaxID=126358 RepID=A0ABD1QE70_9LAMI